MTSRFDPSRLIGRLFYLLVSLVFALGVAHALPPQTTTISDIIYRADGSPASGTLLISWPQFNTSDNKAVASGTMNVTIAAGGAVSIALAPNAGATPAGTFYRVTYKLDDGTTSTEFWSVPATSPTTISAIRSTVVPASMAVQVVSRSYVDSGLALKAADSAVVHKAGDTMTGPLALTATPSAIPASGGTLRLAKSDAINFRNNANSSDVTALSLNGSNQVVLPTLAGTTSAINFTAPAFISSTANPASGGAVRLARTDAITFRNNANSADVTGMGLNASDQAVLPTVAGITSAGSMSASAFASSSANAASAGVFRLAQADGVKFRNNANTGDLNALSEAGDVLQVGETTNGINVPGPANFANLTASGTVTAAAISTGGDSFTKTPRLVWSAFLPGALTSTWTGAQFTNKNAITVVQVDFRAKAGPAGCTTFPVVQITDGTTPLNVTLNAASVAQAVAQNYAANSVLLVKVSTAGLGCTTNASDVNVAVQYKMQ